MSIPNYAHGYMLNWMTDEYNRFDVQIPYNLTLDSVSDLALQELVYYGNKLVDENQERLH